MNQLATSGQLSDPRAGVFNSNPRDFKISFHGTIALFHPLTTGAHERLAEHCPAGAEHQYFGHALTVERRFVEDLLAHAEADGLNIQPKGRN